MELKLGEVYKVTATKIVKSGVVVALEDGSTELVHLSNISNDYVSSIEDFVSVGDNLEAVCQVGKFKPVELSLKNMNLHSKNAAGKHSHRKDNRSRKDNRYSKEKKADRPFKHPSQEEYAAFHHEKKFEGKKDLDKMIAMAQKSYEDKAKQLKSRSQNSRSGGHPSLKRRK